MRLGGRIAAAIEVLETCERQHRPAKAVLRDWGNNHRFAGSKDRHFIANLVYDCMRWRLSTRWLLDDDSARANVLGTLVTRWQVPHAHVKEALDTDPYAPEKLTQQEAKLLSPNNRPEPMPEHIRADVPEWSIEHFTANFDDAWVLEATGLNERAPVDLRVNTLQVTREEALFILGHANPMPTPISPIGLRFAPSQSFHRNVRITSEAAYQRGLVEIQDEASQIAAQLVFAQPGENILDYCSGAGGKTLAMAAAMQNTGAIVAHDPDAVRMANMFSRMDRAGVSIVQAAVSKRDMIQDYCSRFDRVLVDVPCSGSGTWRRHPDQKWRSSPRSLVERCSLQAEILENAAPFVRVGGYLCYATCSVFAVENERQIERFLVNNPQFEQVSVGEVWQSLFGYDKAKPWSEDMKSITLTPASTATDGFFFAVVERRQ